MVGNGKPAPTKKNAPLEAEVIRRAAERLQRADLRVTPQNEVRAAYLNKEIWEKFKNAFLGLPSQSTAVKLSLLLILA